MRRKLPPPGMAIKGPRRYAAYLNISRFATGSTLTKGAPGGLCALSRYPTSFVLLYVNPYKVISPIPIFVLAKLY